MIEQKGLYMLETGLECSEEEFQLNRVVNALQVHPGFGIS